MTNGQIRQEALAKLKRNFLYYIQGGIPRFVFFLLLFIAGGSWFFRSVIRMSADPFSGIGSFLGGFVLISLVTAIGAGLLNYGYQIYLLRLLRYGETDMQNALSGFSYLGVRFLGMMIPIALILAAVSGALQYLLTSAGAEDAGSFIGSILTLIVGLVLWIIPYLIHDHPEMSAAKVLRLAWDKMRGHKWNFFKLQIPPILVLIVFFLVLILGAVFMMIPIIDSLLRTGDFSALFAPSMLIFLILYFVAGIVIDLYFVTLHITYYENRLATPPVDEIYYTIDPES